MAIVDLFSRRRAAAARAGQEDVYQYDTIPISLRVQASQIAIESIGAPARHLGYYGAGMEENPFWKHIEKLFCREKGCYSIGKGEYAGQRVGTYMHECSTEDWLDLLELICRVIAHFVEKPNLEFFHQWELAGNHAALLDELNHRFRQAGVGYQFEDNCIVRVDSQYVHSEVVRPALILLSGKSFSGPREEFLQAHKHYRASEYRQAVAMAGNACLMKMPVFLRRKAAAGEPRTRRRREGTDRKNAGRCGPS